MLLTGIGTMSYKLVTQSTRRFWCPKLLRVEKSMEMGYKYMYMYIIQ